MHQNLCRLGIQPNPIYYFGFVSLANFSGVFLQVWLDTEKLRIQQDFTGQTQPPA